MPRWSLDMGGGEDLKNMSLHLKIWTMWPGAQFLMILKGSTQSWTHSDQNSSQTARCEATAPTKHSLRVNSSNWTLRSMMSLFWGDCHGFVDALMLALKSSSAHIKQNWTCRTGWTKSADRDAMKQHVFLSARTWVNRVCGKIRSLEVNWKQ